MAALGSEQRKRAWNLCVLALQKCLFCAMAEVGGDWYCTDHIGSRLLQEA